MGDGHTDAARMDKQYQRDEMTRRLDNDPMRNTRWMRNVVVCECLQMYLTKGDNCPICKRVAR